MLPIPVFAPLSVTDVSAESARGKPSLSQLKTQTAQSIHGALTGHHVTGPVCGTPYLHQLARAGQEGKVYTSFSDYWAFLRKEVEMPHNMNVANEKAQ